MATGSLSPPYLLVGLWVDVGGVVGTFLRDAKQLDV